VKASDVELTGMLTDACGSAVGVVGSVGTTTVGSGVV
jgi:hypothetical protein